MGRHSSPTALTRAAKRAGVATAALAAGATMTVAGTGTAQADTVPGATEAQTAYGALLAGATANAGKAIAGVQSGITQVVGVYNGIPVIASVVPVTANGITVPYLGTAELNPTSTANQAYYSPSYQGVLGDYSVTGGLNWWTGPFGIGGAPVLNVNKFVDPLGIADFSTELGFPTLEIGNGGFTISDGDQTRFQGGLKNLFDFDGDFHLPMLEIDDYGFHLQGPAVHGITELGKGGALGVLNAGLTTGSIGYFKPTGEFYFYAPALTTSDFQHPAEPASFTLPGVGEVTGRFSPGDATIGRDVLDINLPEMEFDFESEEIDAFDIGTLKFGGEVDGGTIEEDGLHDAVVEVHESAGETDNSTELKVDANQDDGVKAVLENTTETTDPDTSTTTTDTTTVELSTDNGLDVDHTTTP